MDEDTSTPEADLETNTEPQETQEEPKEPKPQMELDVEPAAPHYVHYSTLMSVFLSNVNYNTF